MSLSFDEKKTDKKGAVRFVVMKDNRAVGYIVACPEFVNFRTNHCLFDFQMLVKVCEFLHKLELRYGLYKK